MQTIEITIQPNGQTRVETKGFVGPSCQAASQFLEKAIGATTAEALTPSFHQTHNLNSTHTEQEASFQNHS